jgi:MFS family permease
VKFSSDLFRAFRHRNYRLYWAGFSLSLIGTWMQTLAMGWLVWRLTKSPFWLGVVGAMPQLPSLIFGSIGGALVDRTVKRRVLYITQTGMAISALVLGVLTVMDVVRLTDIVIIAAISGVFAAVDAPARLAFVTDLVGKEDIGNAVALNASMFNAARLVGPAIAGLLVPVIGEGGCFLVNAISFVALIIGLSRMKNLPPPIPANREPLLSQLREAYNFVIASPVIRDLMLNVIFFAGFGLAYTTLMPVFADEILDSGVRGLGALMGATGIGAFVGGVLQAALPRGARRGRVVIYGAFGLALSLLLFAFSRSFILSLFILPFVGFSSISMLASTNTLLQSLSPDHLRGRVLGFYTTAFLGILPVGSFLLGVVASQTSAPLALIIATLICLGVALATLLRNERLRAV